MFYNSSMTSFISYSCLNFEASKTKSLLTSSDSSISSFYSSFDSSVNNTVKEKTLFNPPVFKSWTEIDTPTEINPVVSYS